MGKNIIIDGVAVNNCSVIKVKDNETGNYIEYSDKLSLLDYLKGNFTKLTKEDFGNATKIPKYFFMNNKKLTEVELGDNIIEVGYAAFYNCSNIQKIVIPESVTTFGSQCFDTEHQNMVVRFLSSTPPEYEYFYATFTGNSDIPLTFEVPEGSYDVYRNAIPVDNIIIVEYQVEE